jgi:hypothetical protein
LLSASATDPREIQAFRWSYFLDSLLVCSNCLRTSVDSS